MTQEEIQTRTGVPTEYHDAGAGVDIPNDNIGRSLIHRLGVRLGYSERPQRAFHALKWIEDKTWEELCEFMAPDSMEGPDFWKDVKERGELKVELAYPKDRPCIDLDINWEEYPDHLMWTVEIRGKDDKLAQFKIKDTWQDIRIGRAVRKAFPKWDDSFVEKLTNEIKAHFKPLEVTLLEGQDIRWAYAGQNYHEKSGSLRDSCLRQAKKQFNLELFVDNPEIVKLATVFKGGKVLARAIVWMKNSLGVPLMDRCYGPEDVREKLRQYARTKGWYSKYRDNSSSQTGLRDPDGMSVIEEVEVKIDWEKYVSMPYMDTMFAGHPGGISNIKTSKSEVLFQKEHGNYEAIPKVWSYVDHCYTTEGTHFTLNPRLTFSAKDRVRDDFGNTTHRDYVVTLDTGERCCKLGAYQVADGTWTRDLSKITPPCLK